MSHIPGVRTMSGGQEAGAVSGGRWGAWAGMHCASLLAGAFFPRKRSWPGHKKGPWLWWHKRRAQLVSDMQCAGVAVDGVMQQAVQQREVGEEK